MSFLHGEMYDFSSDFIDFLKSKGFTLGNKLGQGASSVAYEGIMIKQQEQQEQEKRALVITPWDYDKLSWIEDVMKLQSRAPGTVKLHDYLIYDGKITSAEDYPGVATTVQIMDLVPWTLAEYMFKHVLHLPFAQKAQFVIDIYEQLCVIYDGLAKEGLSYFDLSTRNIGFTADKCCVLLDLEGIMGSYRPKGIVLMNFMLRDVIRKVHTSEFPDVGFTEWERTLGICCDSDEALQLQHILEEHIQQREP